LISVSVSARLLFFRLILPVLTLAIIAVTLGVLRLRSASPSLDRSSLQYVIVQSGPMICRVEGLGTLVPEDVRWLAAGTEGRVDQVFLRPGARVRANTVILQLSNPDIVREITDAELAIKNPKPNWPTSACSCRRNS
jgi:multidrug efflux pump subunit AcrA (membrane-fusion protein)